MKYEPLFTISLNSLSKTFVQADATIKLISSATYKFERTITVALMGVSGSGKSTLLHMIAGFEKPTAGTILYNDSATRSGLETSVGFLYQSPYLIDELSVKENVMIKGLIEGHYIDQATERTYELLTQVGLHDKADYPSNRLSGGEQQRVALARALYSKPDFILADEPTAHLDTQTKKSIIDLLLTCHRRWGMGLIVATHDEYVAQRMDCVLLLDKGMLTEERSSALSSHYEQAHV